jgi:diguanylate cyclase (GGDEF)-like protein
MSSINPESLNIRRDIAVPTVCVADEKGEFYLPNTPTFKGYIHDKRGERVICVEINDVYDDQSNSKKNVIITVPNRGATASVSPGEHSVITYTKTIDLEQLSVIDYELLIRMSEIFSTVDEHDNTTWSVIVKPNRLLAFLQSVDLLEQVDVKGSFATGYQHDSALDLESLILTEDATTIKDPLTGLYGKGRLISDVMLDDPVIQAIKNPCMLSIDIAGMGIANSALGKEAVDEYVRGFAEILKERFGDSCCFRVGGDEFVVITSAENKKRLKKELLSLKNELKKYRESFYKKYEVDVTKAQHEFRFRACVDELLNEFKREYREVLVPRSSKQISKQNKITEFFNKKQFKESEINLHDEEDPYEAMRIHIEKLFESFLQENYYQEAEGFDLNEMVISVSKSKMNKDIVSNVLVLGEYVAPIVLNSDKGVSLFDIHVGLTFGDKGIQKAKSNPSLSYIPKRANKKENPIMRKALEEQIESVNMLMVSDRSNKSNTSMDSQLAHINSWGNAMKDYSLQGKALRYEMIKDRTLGEIFQVSNERQTYVFQLDKEGFGIDNKVHGSERADKMLEIMIDAVKRYTGDCMVIRDKGGRLTFFVNAPLVTQEQEEKLIKAQEAQKKISTGFKLSENELIDSQYVHPLVEELKTIAYYSAREYLGYLEGIKRTVLQHAFKNQRFLDFKKPEVLDNKIVRLFHGMQHLSPEMSIQDLFDSMPLNLSKLPTEWEEKPKYAVVGVRG